LRCREKQQRGTGAILAHRGLSCRLIAGRVKKRRPKGRTIERSPVWIIGRKGSGIP